MMSTIQVLLADDAAEFRQALREILDQERGIRVVGEAWDGEQAVRLAREMVPDVVLMDVAMPRLNGIKATRKIRAGMSETVVLGLSMHGQWRYREAMLEAGASGYLLKGDDFSEMVLAIRAAAGSQTL